MQSKSVPMNKKRRGAILRLYDYLTSLPMLDIPFLIIVLMLLGVGLAMLFSAGFAQSLFKTGSSYTYIIKQSLFAVFGVVVMLVVSTINQNAYKRLILPFYVLCTVLLIVVLIVSKDSEKRWLYIGSFQFQPSEFAKLAVVLFLAQYISAYRDKMDKFVSGILIPGAIFALPCLLVAVETHLSGAILIFLIGATLTFVGGSKIKYILTVAGLGVGGASLLVFFTTYMQKRITVWLHPESDPIGDGFQPLQSLLTIGSGGLFGLGYGKSRQKYLYLPEPHNDFIFSVISEELGFIGVVVIIILFALLIWRGIYIAMKARDTFSSLVVVGIISNIAFQIILNLAVVSNSIPTTGISLPFFSYGGTALVVLLAEIGLVLNISRYANIDRGTQPLPDPEEKEEKNTEVEQK